MASGAEMAITQGLKLAMKAAGIAPEQIERDVVRMVQAVLSFDDRLRRIEQHMGIVPKEEYVNGKIAGNDGRQITGE